MNDIKLDEVSRASLVISPSHSAKLLSKQEIQEAANLRYILGKIYSGGMVSFSKKSDVKLMKSLMDRFSVSEKLMILILGQKLPSEFIGMINSKISKELSSSSDAQRDLAEAFTDPDAQRDLAEAIREGKFGNDPATLKALAEH